jgi:hypothetical protein
MKSYVLNINGTIDGGDGDLNSPISVRVPFSAEDLKDAERIALEIMQKQRDEYGTNLIYLDGTILEPVMMIHFQHAVPEKPAVPATEAIPEHFDVQVLS